MGKRSIFQHPPMMVLSLALLLVPIVAIEREPSAAWQSSELHNNQLSNNEPKISNENEMNSRPRWIQVNPFRTENEEHNNSCHHYHHRTNVQPSNSIRLVQEATDLKCESGTYPLDILFQGASESLVAKAVGSAEGTRTPSGGYTKAFRGHIDPGNGVWNLGTFSYQHGADSPQEADQKQLARLKRQATEIRDRAKKAELNLGIEEEMNAIDLANQSPLAALGKPGYIEWLAKAYQQGLQGREAILWARVHGYWDVNRNRWNAPGLGNTEPLIRRDQSRRMNAIEQAIAHNISNAEGVSIINSPKTHDRRAELSQTQANSVLNTHESNTPNAPSIEEGTLSFDLK